MAIFDMHADTPAAATDLAAADRFGFDDVSANAGAGGCETIEADDLLDALLRIANAGHVIRLDATAAKLIIAQRGGTPGTDEVQIEHNGTDVQFINPAGTASTSSFTFGSASSQAYAKFFGTVTAKGISSDGNITLVNFGQGLGAGGQNITINNGYFNIGVDLEFTQVADVGVPSTNSARIGAEDVTGTAELIGSDEAGNETQLTPHAADAPPGLYDGTHAEEIHRTINPYLGTVEFINMTRLARMVEAIANGNLATVQALPAAKKRLHVVESIDAYNARTGRKKAKRTWQEVQDAHQARYDSERAAEQARHDEWAAKAAVYPSDLATWTAARDAYAAALAQYQSDLATWLATPTAQRGIAPAKPAPFTDPRPQDPGPEPSARPAADIRKPIPAWLAARGVTA